MPKAKTYTCKSCKAKSKKIGITSVCTQTLNLESGDYTDTDVGDTLHGFCLECATIIPNKKLEALTGLVATPNQPDSTPGKSLVDFCSKKLLVHRHEYGVTTAYCFAKDFSDKDLLLTEDQAIKLANICGLDFEPDKGEELTILDTPDEKDIPTITKDMLK